MPLRARGVIAAGAEVAPPGPRAARLAQRAAIAEA